MSKLEQLINELCSDGVEYAKLAKVCYIASGKDHKKLEDGKFPVYGSGGIMRYVDSFLYNKPSVLIPRKGSISNLFYVEQPFWVVDTIFYTEIDEIQIVPKFLYYVLSRMHLEELNSAGGVPSLTKAALDCVSIPLPPLPVQEEIVRILDKFTALEAELEAELEARKKQYEFYRTVLLTHDKNLIRKYKDIRWFQLSEVFDIKNGYTPSKSNLLFWQDGTIPWFRMEDIRQNGRVLSDAIQHVSVHAIKSGLFEANSIIISTTATIGEHALITEDFLANQQMTCLTIKNEFKTMLCAKFTFYYCFILGELCESMLNRGGGLPIVDMGKFKRIYFPIPTLEEQSQIVSILDRFDALVNDITQGLPAELTARRRQYEYYRDKLLTFKEKAS